MLLRIASIVWLVFLFLPGGLSGQAESYADSLREEISKSAPDSNRVKLYNELGWELKFDDPEGAREALSIALELARRINYPEGIGDAWNYRGVVEDIHGNPEKAIDYFGRALAVRDSLGDRGGVASMYNNIGNLQENQGEFFDALDNYQQSLRIREELGDTARIMRLYYNISILQESMGNYPEALDFIFQYLELVEATGNRENLGNAYNVVGNIKLELDREEEALDYYQQARDFHRKAGNRWEESSALNNIATQLDSQSEDLEEDDQTEEALEMTDEVLTLYAEALAIREELGDVDGLAELYNNIALTHKNRGSYLQKLDRPEEAEAEWVRALRLFRQAEEIWTESNNRQGILQLYNGYGDVYRRQKRFVLAEEYVQRALDLAEKIGDRKALQNAYKDLGRIYAATGDYQRAYEFRRQYDEIRYERINEKQIKDNERREIMYSDRKKQYEIERQQQAILLQEAELKQARILQYSLIGGGAGLLLLVMLLVNRNRIKSQSNRDLAEKNDIIEAERRRSEDLLLNILPAATASELKVNGRAEAKYYDEVSVLFTDFKSFTHIAESLSADELVDMLDECFRAYDRITARYGIEKIKTIGDAYMCAAGLPTPGADHAQRMVLAALDIRAYMQAYGERRRAAGKPAFEVRIGIHSGPVIAGVVGARKFAYDIWGDTVNLAARMEASGEPGEINISGRTYELVKAKFVCTDRGLVAAKNKGEQRMYFIQERRQDFDFAGMRQHILQRLRQDLSSNLTYHSIEHTLEVEQAAQRIAAAEGVNAYDLALLRTAALFHDAGFLRGPEEHEEVSCQICRELLPEYGYRMDEIEQICRMILATQIPQSPEDHLSEILCDADLDYLGSEAYHEIAGQLREELATRNQRMSETEWKLFQYRFLRSHHYHTESARADREQNKHIIRTNLKSQIPDNQLPEE